MLFDANHQTMICMLRCTWLPKLVIIDQLLLCIQTLIPVWGSLLKSYKTINVIDKIGVLKKASTSINRGWAVSTLVLKGASLDSKTEDRVKLSNLSYMYSVPKLMQRGFKLMIIKKVEISTVPHVLRTDYWKELLCLKCFRRKINFNIQLTYNNWNVVEYVCWSIQL